ncbi:hypothetical protein EVAR_18753_1 [Eumeta japonica]|uniref:Uncharacterized protein n=1 Tax=Eumeta variegata TaxID=151549 RepID=A0A4C1UMA2_EUMVA|nr:hypothetical protein EVAR_18753_1 [Eumeta japonica]
MPTEPNSSSECHAAASAISFERPSNPYTRLTRAELRSRCAVAVFLRRDSVESKIHAILKSRIIEENETVTELVCKAIRPFVKLTFAK